MNHSFELLAPAGTMDALIAALHNGADAVYLGGKSFNARSSAGNFDLQEITEAVRHAHLHDAKVYITVNTLLKDEEMPAVLEYVGDLYAAGVDAIILQDIGLASLIRQAFPNLALHASTQMTVHNSISAKFLEDMGFQRIIAERQMTLEELVQMRKAVRIELEVFAHGALCVSYSGQCLMSSLIGGRSGNRGRCAQPCRLEYNLVGTDRGIVENKEGPYLLSTKDLNLAQMLPCLIENRFSGIKIEGRMKRPEYVATVVRIYRTLIDRYCDDPTQYYVTVEEARQLEQIFNRDFTKGFLMGETGTNLMSLRRPNNRGVYIGRVSAVDNSKKQLSLNLEKDLSLGDGIEVWVSVGGRVGTILEAMSVEHEVRSIAYAGETVSIPIDGKFQIGDRVFRTHDHKLIAEAKASFLEEDDKGRIPLKVKVRLKINEPMLIEFIDPDGHVVVEKSERMGETAKNYAADEETIAAQLERTGNTDFYIAEFDWDVEPNTFMPVSIINDMRRKAIIRLQEMLLEARKPHDLDESLSRMNVLKFSAQNSKSSQVRALQPRLAVTVNDLREFESACRAGADIVYWGGDYQKPNQDIPLREMYELLGQNRQRKIELGFAFPRITKDSELDEITKNLERNQRFLPHTVRAANLGQILAGKKFAKERLCLDYSQHTFNSAALAFYRSFGIRRVTLSPELTLEQMQELILPEGMELECIVHGQLPVMITEYCPITTVCTGSASSGQGCSERYCMEESFALKDKLEYVFPIVSNGHCRTFILNSKEMCLFDNLSDFVNSVFSVLRIEASGRGSSYVEQVTSLYRHWLDRYANKEPLDQREMTHAKRVLQDLSAGGITKGHYFRGVE
jgi:U32 family peptidase